MATLPILPNDPVTIAYQQARPFSFGSERNVREHYNGQFNAQEVTDQLQKSTAFTRFRPFRKRKDAVPIYVYRKRQQIQCDICYIDNKKEKENENKKMIVVFIDVFTKWVWVTPIATTSAEEVLNAFYHDFLPNCNPPPKQIHTDKGSEFNNHAFINACRNENIDLRIGQPHPARKCAVVERFNRTIQDILHKQMEAYATDGRWIDLLAPALIIYKNRKHRSIGMSPHQAEQNVNQQQLLAAHLKRYEKAGQPKKPKFKLDDYVQIVENNTGKMRRGYHPKYTAEIFQIAKVFSNLPRARYWVKTLKGPVVTGQTYVTGEKPPITWFENELSAYNPPKTPPFKILKIIQRKQDENGQPVYLIEWQNYGPAYNEWVNGPRLTELKQYLTPREIVKHRL